jgi:hypothetical protein
VRSVVPVKFEPGLVQPGDHVARITANVEAMTAEYDATVTSVAPDSPPHSEAMSTLMRHLRHFFA